MPAFMKLKDVPGESTDQDHDGWVRIESMSSPINRTIGSGAKDNERTRGETILGDVTVVRELDKSSVKIQENCAKGTFFKEVEIHFCATFGSKQVPYLTYKLANVLITSYSFHGTAAGSPLPTEQVTLGYTKAEWNYIILSPEDGSNLGNIPGSYEPATSK